MKTLRPTKNRKKILVVCPTIWDTEELRLIARKGEYEFIFWPYETLNKANPKLFWILLTHLKLLNINRFIDKTIGYFHHYSLDGIISTDDHLGCAITAAVAEKLCLPAPLPRSILTCQHKFYSRLVQEEVVPYATPKFWLINRADSPSTHFPLSFPFFIKPVRGTFSILAKRISSQADLEDLTRLSLLDRLIWHLRLHPFNKLLSRYTEFDQNGDLFLGEEFIDGHHVSLEGYSQNGEIHILGILDSHMYSRTNSFKRFVYPSTLPETIKERIHEIALTLMGRLEFDNGLFEIEMFYSPSLDGIKIIEINPRMCAQFADLFEKVEGVNAYDIQMAIATGQSPIAPPNCGEFMIAGSFVLRVFSNTTVVRLPDKEDINRVKSLFPDVRIRFFCKEGDKLSMRLRQLRDMESVRVAAINVGGKNYDDLLIRFGKVMKELGIELYPPVDFYEVSV